MNKVAIVYWSGIGNTEKMANCMAEGVREAGGEAVLLSPGEFSAETFKDCDAAAFGCPSMGSEPLEEDDEFEPVFAGPEGALGGKKIALSGSYGWGGGQRMRGWRERCSTANLYDKNGLIVNGPPNTEGMGAAVNRDRGSPSGKSHAQIPTAGHPSHAGVFPHRAAYRCISKFFIGCWYGQMTFFGI